MTHSRDYYEDLLVKAIQAGKQETSGLAGDLKASMQKLETKFDRHLELDKLWKEEDKLWKEKAEPVLQIVKNMRAFGKVTLYIVGFLSAIGGAFLIIQSIWKK